MSPDILKDVKLAAQIKLLPDRPQAEALLSTLCAANGACNFVSQAAWQGQTFRQFDLHHLCYRDVRTRFNLSAQVAVRVISKVADSYKLDRKTERKFKSTGSIAYDDQIISWRIPESRYLSGLPPAVSGYPSLAETVSGTFCFPVRERPTSFTGTVGSNFT